MAAMVSTITDTFKTINIRSREMKPKRIARKKSKLMKHSKEGNKCPSIHHKQPNSKQQGPITAARKNNDTGSSHDGFVAPDATMDHDMAGSSSCEDKCVLSSSLSLPSCSSLEVPPTCITFNFPAIEWAPDSSSHRHRQEDGTATPPTDEEDLYQLLRNQSYSLPRSRRSNDTSIAPPSCGKGSLVRSLAFLKELCELSNASPGTSTSHQVMV